jgi:hypothetical protein
VLVLSPREDDVLVFRDPKHNADPLKDIIKSWAELK